MTHMLFNKSHEKSKNLGMKTAIFVFIFAVVIIFLYLLQNTSFFSQSPQPAPTPIPASSRNIIVLSPVSEEQVSQDFLVKGKARVFENVVSIRVTHKITGRVLLSDSTIAYAQDIGQFGDFAYTVRLKNDVFLKVSDDLLLEVFQASPKDGSDTDTVSIPLRFNPSMQEKLFPGI